MKAPHPKPKTAAEKFKAHQRIRTKELFEQVFRQGIFSKGNCLNFWVWRPGQEAGYFPQIGVIVSRKVSSKATKRNLLKRRVREVFRRTQHHIEPGAVLMVQVKRKKELPSYEEIRRDFEEMLKKTGVWKRE